jgi:ABC-type antimicrobial peptide transport system permease subunit
MALGATRDRILGWVGGQAARLTLWGLVIGAVGAAVASRLLASVLFEVDPLDPAVFLAVAGVLVAAALGAAWLPARRAVKVDPAVVLAEEG